MADSENRDGSRLCVLCSAIDTDLERIGEALREELGEYPELSQLGLRELQAPEGLGRTGWMMTELTPAPELSLHLRTLTGTYARVLRDAVVGIFWEVGSGRSVALLHGPGSLPRFTEGPIPHVLRQVARWLESDAQELIEYFQVGPRSEDLNAPIDLSEVEPPPPPPGDPDSEDQFVERKLNAARALMQQYLSRRK